MNEYEVGNEYEVEVSEHKAGPGHEMVEVSEHKAGPGLHEMVEVSVYEVVRQYDE